MSDGRSGISISTSGMRAAAVTAMAMATIRQPPWPASMAITGMKISEPVAVLAVSTPIARPRRVTNQRFTMVAASTVATQPLARPDSTPQVAISCQGWVMKHESRVAVAIRPSAQLKVLRTPNPCIRAAANGPTKP